MKIRHVVILIATFFLPACSNNNQTISEAKRLQSENNNIDDNISNRSADNESVHYGVDVIDNRNDAEPFPNTEEAKDENPDEEPASSTLLSTFSTKVYTKTNARMNNLNIVCSKISGVVVAPGEEFSYNAVAGPYDKSHGFGKATVLLGNGKEIQGYGGGVCQVSSTLYNAVKDIGVEITERHNHSKDVHYVPKNQDATVSYGSLDFKFINRNNYPIRIQASANKQNVTVEIYKN